MNNNFYIKKYSIWNGSDTCNSPNIDFIPSLTRRRLTNVEKIGLYLANLVAPFSEETKIVFSSRYGEWQQTIKLIQQMHDEGEMSPAGFSHSVHNAMPGILSIINKTPYNYTTVAANEQTIDCALIEATTSNSDILFIYAEESTPNFYKDRYETPFNGHGIALLISSKKDDNSRKINVASNNTPLNKNTTFAELVEFAEGKTELLTKFCKLKDEL